MPIADCGYYSWTGKGAHGFVEGSRDNSGIEVIGIKEALDKFNAIHSENPNTNKQIKMIMRYIITKSAKRTRLATKSILSNDSRKAYLAVKSLVYKRIFGGNLSLLDKRKKSQYAASLPPVQQQTGRGGNRRTRSERTKNIMSYCGVDRGFILRFLNNGTSQRNISTANNRTVNKYVGRGHSSASLSQFKNGYRGKISGKNWFSQSSLDAMEMEMQELLELMEEAINMYWTGGTSVNPKYDILDNR